MTIQRETTEAKAPSVSAEETSHQTRALRLWRGQRGTASRKGLPERCQPKVMVRVAGRVESQREKRLPIMLPMSASKWAASVMMAKLCARYPPARGNGQPARERAAQRGRCERGTSYTASLSGAKVTGIVSSLSVTIVTGGWLLRARLHRPWPHPLCPLPGIPPQCPAHPSSPSLSFHPGSQGSLVESGLVAWRGGPNLPTTSPAMKRKHTVQAAYSCLRACSLSGERPA